MVKKRVAWPLLSVPARNCAQTVDSEGGSSFMLNNPSCPRCSTTQLLGPALVRWHHQLSSHHRYLSIGSCCANLHLSPAGPIPAHDRSSPPDPIRSALVERENEALSYSIRFDELTTRISMNRESLSQASFVNTIATLATKSSNFHETSVEDGKAFFEQHNDETTLDHTSMIRAMKNYNERMEGCKQEIAQLRLEVTAWEDTRRNDEMRGSAPQRHIKQDMIERQWLVKSFRGIDDNINCSRVIGSLLDIRPSALSCPTKSLAERNICLLIFRITFEAVCPRQYPGYSQDICR
ncbi:hypothetical protein BFJ68_g16599 [Fusarium oxysporum]|uniref:Uncharacterized protein n=1 Tax=Fusarium oxysporum TaxID=5507 RepID=A0A420PBP4_FUSOX|nr:hypothetical protein BFJ68_g16599 [Fusarium oxysporum]